MLRPGLISQFFNLVWDSLTSSFHLAGCWRQLKAADPLCGLTSSAGIKHMDLEAGVQYNKSPSGFVGLRGTVHLRLARLYVGWVVHDNKGKYRAFSHFEKLAT